MATLGRNAAAVAFSNASDSSASSASPGPGSSPDAAWFAVWTRSRHEQVVCTELLARGIEHFLPTFTAVSRWKDRVKRIAWPLFPGYCFVRAAASHVGNVIRCNGVVAVLSAAGQPIPVPAAEIEALQRLVSSGLTFDPCELIHTGCMVRVVTGPLAGVTGRLVRKGPHDQLVLAVQLLNSGARVQVSAWEVERL